MKVNNFFATILAVLALSACDKVPHEPQGSVPPKASQNIVTVMATTDLKDVEEMIAAEVKKETGIDINWAWGGTMDNTEKVMTGQHKADIAWFANAKYVLSDEGARSKVKLQEKIMLTPLVVGVFESDVAKLGWKDKTQKITWADIAKEAKSGKLRYAMSNPASSNQGYTALMGVATATSNSSEALQLKDINQEVLANFLKGYALRGDNSTYLSEQFLIQQSVTNGPNAFINYESWLLGLNNGGKLKEQLVLFYPKEGVATADYPMLLINDAKRNEFISITNFLRTPAMQKKIAEMSLRRPIVPSVFAEVKSLFPRTPDTLIEMPFTASKDVSDAILYAYLNEYRKPASSVFLLDVSGSMAGIRLENLKQAVKNISGMDKSLTGSLSSLNNREVATVVQFNHRIKDVKEFAIPALPTSKDEKLEEIRKYTDGLEAKGGTAIFSSTIFALQEAAKNKEKKPDMAYSVVLFTDGENADGMDLGDFKIAYQDLGAVEKSIPVFAILYGEGKSDQMTTIAKLSGGKVFDAKKTPLSAVFKEIRANQ